MHRFLTMIDFLIRVYLIMSMSIQLITLQPVVIILTLLLRWLVMFFKVWRFVWVTFLSMKTILVGRRRDYWKTIGSSLIVNWIGQIMILH